MGGEKCLLCQQATDQTEGPQGLKPGSLFWPFTARLKSCPDTKHQSRDSGKTCAFRRFAIDRPIPSSVANSATEREDLALVCVEKRASAAAMRRLWNVKGIALVFVLLGVFVFAVAFAIGRIAEDLEEGSSRTSIRTRRESPRTRCLMVGVSDEDELGLLSKARPWKAKPLSAVTQTEMDCSATNSVLFLELSVRGV